MSLGTYGVLCACLSSLLELCATLPLVLNALIASRLQLGFRKKLGHIEGLSEFSQNTRGWCGRGKESLCATALTSISWGNLLADAVSSA